MLYGGWGGGGGEVERCILNLPSQANAPYSSSVSNCKGGLLRA